MTTPPPRAPDDDETQTVPFETATSDAEGRVIVNWGFGLVPPFSVRAPRGGVDTIPRPPSPLTHVVRLAGQWTLRHLSRLTTFHRPANTSRDRHHSDPGTGSETTGGTDVRDAS
jgi:hypothetical protein